MHNALLAVLVIVSALLTSADAGILIGAAAVVMLSMSVIGAASTGRRARGSPSLLANLLIAMATIGIGVAAQITSPVVMILTLAGLCVSQLVVSLPRGAQKTTLPPHSSVLHQTQ